MSYKHNRAWRLSHTAGRNAQRKRYYNKYPGYSRRASGKRWVVEDADYILTSEGPDRVLRAILGRSIQAIQIKRCKLLKEAAIC